MSHDDADRVAKHGARDRFHALRQRRAEEKALQARVRARGHDFVDLRGRVETWKPVR